MSEFALWNGDYVKKPYLTLIDGEEVPCWPNAGIMNACDGSGRYWMPEDNVQVRICTVDEHVAASRALRKEATK